MSSSALPSHVVTKASDSKVGSSHLVCSVFPSFAATLVATGGILIEVALAATMPSHALWAGGYVSLMAVAFMAWFWVTVTWLGRSAALRVMAVRDRESTIRNRMLAATMVLAATFLVIGYFVSWAGFLQIGRFLNWEAVRFTLCNFNFLMHYFAAADAWQIFWLALMSAGLLVTLPTIGWLLAQGKWTEAAEHSAAKWMISWLMFTLASLWIHSAIRSDTSEQRRVLRQNQIYQCLNPAMTMAVSLVDTWRLERIEACLDVATLTPLPVDSALLPSPPPARDGETPRRSVLIVAIESLRHDVIYQTHQGREITPNLNKLARAGLQLTNAYSQSTHSDYADVCIVSSLYPLRTRQHHFYGSDDPWPKLLLHDLLHQNGYRTAIISSQNETWGGMDSFLDTGGLDLFYHPQRSDAESTFDPRDPGFAHEIEVGALQAGNFADGFTVDKVSDWIEQQTALGKPFYLYTNFQSSHFPYVMPDDCPRPFQPCDLAPEVKFTYYPEECLPNVRNAYYNAIAETDRQLGRLIDKLRELGKLDDTIVVVTGENGEAFRENGCIGHAGNPVEPVLHIAAVLHAPELIEPQVEDYPFEHVDLAPTLGALLGLPPQDNFQGMDIRSAERPPADERLLFFHVNSPMAVADAVLFGCRWKWISSEDFPTGVLYDLESDPEESRDVAASHPQLAQQLAEALRQWRNNQLAYYCYPMYYREYYPPKSPRWRDLQESHSQTN